MKALQAVSLVGEGMQVGSMEGQDLGEFANGHGTGMLELAGGLSRAKGESQRTQYLGRRAQ